MSRRQFTSRNVLDNGRGQVGTAGAALTSITGVGSVALSTVADPGFEGFDLDTAFKVTLTGSGSAGALQVDLADGSHPPIKPCAIPFARAIIKHASGPDSLSSLRFVILDAAGNTTQTPIFPVLQKPSSAGETLVLEGFDLAAPYFPDHMIVQVYLGPVTADAVFHVALQLDTDARTDVPEFTDDEVVSTVDLGSFGLSASGQFGRSDSPLAADDVARLHYQLGSRMLRGGVPLDEYGTFDAGVPDMPVFDEWVDALRQRNLKLVLTMGQPFGDHTLADLDSADFDDLAAYQAELVQRYGDVICAVEWFNEPNFDLFYGSTPDAAHYTAALAAIYPAVKAVAPDVPVLAGALANADTTTGGVVSIPDFLAGMYAEAGSDLPWDALSTHPHPAGARSGVATGSTAYGFHKGLDTVRSVRDAHGDVSPIWITETGYQRQASLSPRQEEVTQGRANALLRGIASRMDDVDGVVIHTLHAATADDYDHVHLDTLSFRPAGGAVAA